MSSAPTLPPAGPTGPALAAAVELIERGNAALTGLLTPTVLTDLPDAVVGDLAVRLAAAAEQTQAGAWAALARVADSGLPQGQGAASAGSWWCERIRGSKDDAATQVRLARRLSRHYGATAAAWRDGQIRIEHARVIAGGVDAVLGRHARRIRREHNGAGDSIDPAALSEQLAQIRGVIEEALLTAAKPTIDADGKEQPGASPEQLRALLAQARVMADPDGASDEQMARELEAKLRIQIVGDQAVTTHQGSLEVGDKLRVILDYFRTLAFHRGAPARDGEPAPIDMEPDPVTGDPIIITNAQKDAAAFEDWINATLDAGLGTRPVTERPHLDVVVTVNDLIDGTGTAVLSRTNTPVPVATAQRIACDATVRVVIVDGVYRDPRTGLVIDPVVGALLLGAAGLLDYGRGERIVPQRLRRALAHRDKGCAFPGCGRPPAHTQAHHIQYWERGGVTSLANTVLLCSRHHHFVHEGRWTITLRPGMAVNQSGCWRFSPPGREPRL